MRALVALVTRVSSRKAQEHRKTNLLEHWCLCVLVRDKGGGSAHGSPFIDGEWEAPKVASWPDQFRHSNTVIARAVLLHTHVRV